MKVKRKLKIFIVFIVILGIGAFAYAATSISSENGTITFNQNEPQSYELVGNNNRSKKVNLQMTVEESPNKGFISVEFIDTDKKVKLRKKVFSGEKLDETITFSRGGKGKIVISPESFDGKVSYSKKTVSLF